MENPPLSSLQVLYELTAPHLPEFFPPGSYLRKEKYPLFHYTLEQNFRADLGWKIDQCKLAGIRLDCENVGYHHGFIPVNCNRRICPACSTHQMAKNILRYHPLSYFPNNQIKRKNWRLRFWTFTSKAEKNKSLREPMEAVSKAVRLYWRNVYGDRSKPRKGPFPDAGGIFVIEVGEGWNVHAHALIFGPYHKNLDDLREIWSKSLKQYSWSGSRIHVKNLTRDPNGSFEGAVVELISYPLNPDKRIDLDEKLLAYIEMAMSGRNRLNFDGSGKIPAIRRITELGSFYRLFPAYKPPHLICPECLEDNHISGMTWFKEFDDFKGRRLKQEYFKNENHWFERLNYTENLNKAKTLTKGTAYV